ncbi:hypothetical protein L2230_06650, partial [Xanthomonas perforans]|uniref:hypothetical protein n=1 Tax=Xanthomonas perforans TaxID=442694 RepID=UPI001F18237C
MSDPRDGTVWTDVLDGINDCTADETAAQRCASSGRVAFLIGAGCHAVGLLQALVHRIVELR